MEDRFLELTPDLLEGITPEKLRNAYLTASAPKPVPTINLDHVVPIRASVTDALRELVDELPRVRSIGFRELTSSLVTRLEVVVRFLAVLELFKRGHVDLHQAVSFGDIQIQWLPGDRAGHPDVEEPTDWDEDFVLVDAYDG